MKRTVKFYILGCTFIITCLMLTTWANSIVQGSSEPYLTDNIDSISNFKVGLLLGTSKKLKNGNQNDFFFNRIIAAKELYLKGKIQYILISGDNSRVSYNEPQDMKSELVKQGIPDSVIYLDHAGFRTFDSVVRAKAVFGQNKFLVISQKFHNERAVYIARELGMEAFGYNAKDVNSYKGFKTKVREFFARAKVFLDLKFGAEPKFLGEKVVIG